MNEDNTIKQSENQNLHKNKIHKVLAYSYLFLFILFLFSLVLDFIFPLMIFNRPAMAFLGLPFLIFGTFLIFWAQISSHKLNKENMNKETFSKGPYRYTRGPTIFGVFLVMLGFGITTNALFVIIIAILAFLINKFTFIKKEEEILAEKYGIPYLEYKQSVKF